jgi:S1-C subfamily serine protease
MKRLATSFVVIIIVCIIWNTSAYSINIPEDITFVGLDYLGETVNKSVFAIQVEKDRNNPLGDNVYINIGTGFLIGKDNTVIGITCAHIIRPALLKNKTIFIGLNTEKGFKRCKCDIKIIDDKYDVAIIIPQRPDDDIDTKLQNIVFSMNLLGKKQNIREGRGVLVPGYPLGLGLEYDENHPILKFGIVAQYAGRDSFLIDAVANPGNSGSPVFELKERKIIGMVQSYNKDFIDLYDREGGLAAKIPYNSGLSQAINSEILQNIIDKLRIR